MNQLKSIPKSIKRVLMLAVLFSVPVVGVILISKASAEQVHTFSNSKAQMNLQLATGVTTTVFTGPAQIRVGVGSSGEASDTDGDGLDQVMTELVSMDLTGSGLAFGLQSGATSTGEMEELTNVSTGTLDVSPYASTGTVDSFFDVFFELTLGDGTKLHNQQSMRIHNKSIHVPPEFGEEYSSTGTIPLLDENNSSTLFGITGFVWTPDPRPSTTLLVIKNVLNDDGGNAIPGSFTMTVIGNNPNPSSFPGSSTGTKVDIGPGAYEVSEVGPSGYASSSSPSCSGTIESGESKTCVITNDDIATSTPTTSLFVIKNVVNDDDGTSTPDSFTLTVLGNNPNPVNFPGSSSGTEVVIGPGIYSVTEAGPLGYASSSSADCSGTITHGEHKTCTITNDDIPTSPPNILDHLKCHVVKRRTPIQAVVFLLDQFGIIDQTYERDIVSRSDWFCNPTRKIHGKSSTGIFSLKNHLTWYRLRSIFDDGDKDRTVVVKNQLVPNGQKLEIDESAYLAVPTQKIAVNNVPTGLSKPEDMDHFKCYEAKGDRLRLRVRLQDQFDRMPPGDNNTFEDVVVQRPQFLCNPVYKVHFTGFDDAGNPEFNRTDISHPDDHLVCYDLSEERNRTKNISISNQFGTQQLATSKGEMLCVLSSKEVISGQNPSNDEEGDNGDDNEQDD